jgi:hypothetical protein
VFKLAECLIHGLHVASHLSPYLLGACGVSLYPTVSRMLAVSLRVAFTTAAGTRHEKRPVAIDSCVARRPPALKASAEDAAVERLAQLLLSVPDVSRSLLQQLLANIKHSSRGQCSRLTLDGAADSEVLMPGSSRGLMQSAAGNARPGSSTGGAAAAAVAVGSSTGGASQFLPAAVLKDSQGGCGDAAAGALSFSDADIARFQAGLKKCLTGVLQIKVRPLQQQAGNADLPTVLKACGIMQSNKEYCACKPRQIVVRLPQQLARLRMRCSTIQLKAVPQRGCSRAKHQLCQLSSSSA